MLVAEARKYIWVGYTSARANMAYMLEIVARATFIMVLLFIFLQLWRVTYAQTGSAVMGDLTLPQMLWYLVVTESISISSLQTTYDVDQDVRTGALAVQLIRPLSYPLYRLFTTLGERTVRFLTNFTIGIIIALLFVGPIPLTPGGILIAILAIPMAFTLDFLGLFLIGLCAFWIEDTSGIALIYSRLTWILGGMLIPLELFPSSLQPLLRALPFSSILYGPARLFVHPDLNFLLDLLLRQSIAILCFVILVALVYRTGVKRINANGG
jgi:ABC-2 type transport system permease protein